MIEFTIKTLDSNNHNFQVEDGITIQQLKEKVREQMGIEINLQRLIFCGRVLQDERKLSEYDVHGKVVHLVQRAPPSPESRHSTHSGNASGNNGEGSNAHPQQPRRPGYANILREDQVSLSPTTGRLDFIRLMVSEIKTSLASLQVQAETEDNSAAPASGEANLENMETDPTPSATQEENDGTLEENGESTPDSAARAQNARRRSYRAIRALRARHSRPRDLGQLMEELEALQEQFAPHRANYTSMLMAANNAEPPVYSEEERQSAQRTVDIVSDIMHSFAHAYHAVSDINFQVGQRNPRLTSEASVMRHPIPMQQAHINVVQSNRRQNATGANGPGNATTPPQTAAAAATVTNATTAAPRTTFTTANPSTRPSAPDGPEDAPEGQAPQAGRNTTQPTVNINIQPDPITYQVEIETRVPIAFALENALLNGLANAGSGVNMTPHDPAQAQNNQPNQQAGQQAAQQAGQQNGQQAGQPAGQQPGQQAGQQGQANRRQVLFDFENLFRGLGQTGNLGGVEVVMSMEEIPNGGIVGQVHPSAAAAPVGGQTPPTLQHVGMQHTDGGVILGPMPWGGAPSADLLQNIVSSVIRQGLLPGGEAVALQVAHALPNPSAAIHVNSEQLPGAQNAPGRHGNLHVRRATTAARAHAVTLNNFIYDRFLLCVSPHARRRLLRRREQQQNQAVATARARSDRAAAQSIEALRERNTNFTQNHMQTMVELFTSEPTRATFTNAFLAAVARHLFLTEPSQSSAGEAGAVPSEFNALRQMLRTYLQDVLVRSGGVHNGNTFDDIAEFMLTEQESFLRRAESITAIRPDVDLIASIRALIGSHLPDIVASVMSDVATESFVARFYAVLSHLFSDLCTLISYCCRDGADGLRTLFTTFLEEKLRDFGEPIQQLLLTLGMENLGIVVSSMNAITSADPVQQFVIRRTPAQTAQPPSPMDVAPAAEAPQTAPMASGESTPCESPAPPTPTPPAPRKEQTSPSDVTSTTSESDTASASRQSLNNEAAPVSQSHSSHSVASQSGRPSRPERETAPTRNSPDSQTNLGFVPPMMLLQHWGEEWVPVFTRDQHAQNEAPPEPYSDAYLSGMPSRKRRCVRQARPPNTLDSFMNESVREVSERPAAVDSGAVRLAFREHMRSMARTRASSSSDYDPLRYASAARFLAADPKKEAPKKTEDNA